MSEQSILPVDLQKLYEDSYSEYGLMKILRPLIPPELIEQSINVINSFVPKYDTQITRWNQLKSQDLSSFFTDFWAIELRMSDITLTAAIAQLKFLIKSEDALGKVKTMGEIIYLLADNDLLDLYRDREDQWCIKNNREFDHETKLDCQKVRYLPPMVCAPKIIKNYKDSHYLTVPNGGVILNNYVNSDLKYPLDFVNYLNQGKWKVDLDFLKEFELSMPADKYLQSFVKKTWETCLMMVNQANNCFYFGYQLDKRLRSYADGYHLNPQGDKYRKAMLEFHEEELLTEEGLYWLKVDIANSFGLDKLPTFDKRVEWFDANEKDLESLIPQCDADTRPLFHKGILAYRKAMRGLPIGHIGRLDAIASGIQLWAVLTNCEKSCETVGLLSDVRVDPYTNLGELIGTAAARNDLKLSIMPFFYGSAMKPKEVFGDNIGKFLDVMESELPSPCIAKNEVIESWNPRALGHGWTMLDGYEVYIPSMVKTSHRVQCLDNSSFTHVINHNKPQEYSVSLAANFIQSCDALVTRMMHKRCDFRITFNHDCFGCHPNHMGKLIPAYAGCLADIGDSDLMDNFFKSIGSDMRVIHEPALMERIRKSKYPLS